MTSMGGRSAGHCPSDVKRIATAMSGLCNDKITMAKSMSAKGLVLHKNGKHGQALKILHQAMAALNIKH